MPSVQLLNQTKKIRETELQIYPSSFVINISLLLKTTFHLHKVKVFPASFEATFAAVFVLIYR